MACNFLQLFHPFIVNKAPCLRAQDKVSFWDRLYQAESPQNKSTVASFCSVPQTRLLFKECVIYSAVRLMMLLFVYK